MKELIETIVLTNYRVDYYKKDEQYYAVITKKNEWTIMTIEFTTLEECKLKCNLILEEL